MNGSRESGLRFRIILIRKELSLLKDNQINIASESNRDTQRHENLVILKVPG